MRVGAQTYSCILWWWVQGNQKSWTCPWSSFITSSFTQVVQTLMNECFFPSPSLTAYSTLFFDVVYTCLSSGIHHHSVGISIQTTAALTPQSSVSWSTISLNLHSKWLVGQGVELELPLFCPPTSISPQVCVHFSPLLKLFSVFLLWIHLASASRWYCTMPSSVRHSAASFTGLLLVIVSFHLL